MYRIEIHSERIRIVLRHSGICIQTIPKQTVKRFESRLIKNSQKSIGQNVIEGTFSLDMPSECIGLKFIPSGSELFQDDLESVFEPF